MSNKIANNPEFNNKRRQFLTGFVISSVAGALATSVSPTVKASSSDNSKGTSETGYRETQHIRDYYDTL